MPPRRIIRALPTDRVTRSQAGQAARRRAAEAVLANLRPENVRETRSQAAARRAAEAELASLRPGVTPGPQTAGASADRTDDPADAADSSPVSPLTPLSATPSLGSPSPRGTPFPSRTPTPRRSTTPRRTRTPSPRRSPSLPRRTPTPRCSPTPRGTPNDDQAAAPSQQDPGHAISPPAQTTPPTVPRSATPNAIPGPANRPTTTPPTQAQDNPPASDSNDPANDPGDTSHLDPYNPDLERFRQRERDLFRPPPRRGPQQGEQHFEDVPAYDGRGACPICTDPFANGLDVVRMTHCGDLFHLECLEPWLRIKSTCPGCRGQVAA